MTNFKNRFRSDVGEASKVIVTGLAGLAVLFAMGLTGAEGGRAVGDALHLPDLIEPSGVRVANGQAWWGPDHGHDHGHPIDDGGVDR